MVRFVMVKPAHDSYPKLGIDAHIGTKEQDVVLSILSADRDESLGTPDRPFAGVVARGCRCCIVVGAHESSDGRRSARAPRDVSPAPMGYAPVDRSLR